MQYKGKNNPSTPVEEESKENNQIEKEKPSTSIAAVSTDKVNDVVAGESPFTPHRPRFIYWLTYFSLTPSLYFLFPIFLSLSFSLFFLSLSFSLFFSLSLSFSLNDTFNNAIFIFSYYKRFCSLLNHILRFLQSFFFFLLFVQLFLLVSQTFFFIVGKSRSFHCRLLVPFSVVSSFHSLSSPRSFPCRLLVLFSVVSSFLSLSSPRSFYCRLRVPFPVVSSFLSLSSPRSFLCRLLVLFTVVSSFLSLSTPRSFPCRLLPFCLSIIFIILLYFYFPLSLKLCSYDLLIITSSRS
ncbi:unnamed protein product [Acanthosepion pharaonis]|uniref:Transmembrane protein n=1 Tax=Acanthosepion pharaonis TaxID=158019 RepID=A0A812B8N4_ACAPH|nr:unnamed protein product [Sepia pharaonis]